MQLFSQEERIEKMRSFGGQDSGVHITSPSVWLAIVGGILLIAALAVWSVAGTIPEYQTVDGIYIGEGECVFFADLENGKLIDEGMTIHVCPNSISSENYGNMTGEITETSDYVSDLDQASDLLNSEILASHFLEDGPMYYLICELDEDDSTVSGFAWTSEYGSEIDVENGTYVTGTVVTEDVHPISLFFN